MSRETRLFLPQILWYIALWFVFSLSLSLFLRERHQRLYSKEKYEKLIIGVSQDRRKADDPCQYYIFGDPVTSEGNYAKVIFYCDKERVATNSLDLSVLPNNSYAALLAETGRINGFSVDKIIEPGSKEWKCFADHEPIMNFGEKIKIKSRVECFFNYSDGEIKALYAKN